MLFVGQPFLDLFSIIKVFPKQCDDIGQFLPPIGIDRIAWNPWIGQLAFLHGAIKWTM